MLALNRDPAFWRDVVDHPQVERVKQGLPFDIEAIVQHDRVTPLASEHGGFLFVELDGFGRIVELHTLFKPEGWGREVCEAGKDALQIMFQTTELITTFETRDRKSQPPRSFGWKSAGDFRDSPIGEIRSWFLTKEAWEASPAGRRKCPQ